MILFYKSVVVLFTAPNLTGNFMKFLKICAINSSLVNTNDFITMVLSFSDKGDIWRYDTRDYYSDKRMFYMVYIYLPLWSLLYTFGGNYFFVESNFKIVLSPLKFYEFLIYIKE